MPDVDHDAFEELHRSHCDWRERLAEESERRREVAAGWAEVAMVESQSVLQLSRRGKTGTFS